ncbi:cupin domain-containing protein [Roseateles sp.]|uniref:cupin domain-containing protein n=1 Tax=Roseateles sp. TaxID=1971397 RepID=UPI003BA6352B
MTTQQHESSIWSHHVEAPGAPAGFTVRTCVPANPDGVEVMLERWQAGSSEPPHSHPGNDMTVVVQGQMRIQFFTRDAAGALHADGPPQTLSEGQTGYVAAGRIHDAQYLQDCKLVYVHERAFGFKAEG